MILTSSVRSISRAATVAVGAAAMAANCIQCPASPLPQQAPPSLHLQVEVNKKVYVVGEPIVAAVTLKNNGARPAAFTWFSYDNGFYLSVKNATGTSVPLFGEQGDPSPRLTRWQASIAPASKHTTAFDLVVGDIVEAHPAFPRAEVIDFRHTPVQVVRHSLWPGKYSVEVAQDTGLVPPAPATEAEKQSPPWHVERLRAATPFTVRQPNTLEVAALRLFKRRPYPLSTDETVVSQTQRQSQDDALAAMRVLVADYPGTPYAPYARYYIGRILQVQGKYLEAAQAYETLFVKHPRFPLRADALYYLSFCQAQAGNTGRARQVLQKLKKEFPSHLIAPNIIYRDAQSRIEALDRKLNPVATST